MPPSITQRPPKRRSTETPSSSTPRSRQMPTTLPGVTSARSSSSNCSSASCRGSGASPAGRRRASRPVAVGARGALVPADQRVREGQGDLAVAVAVRLERDLRPARGRRASRKISSRRVPILALDGRRHDQLRPRRPQRRHPPRRGGAGGGRARARVRLAARPLLWHRRGPPRALRVDRRDCTASSPSG